MTSPVIRFPQIEKRIQRLKKEVADQEIESAKAISKYKPKSKTRIDDINSSVVDLIRSLPGVAHVLVRLAPKKPTRRIIHLLDFHYIAKDQFALDMKTLHGRKIKRDELERLFHENLYQVNLLQIEHMAVFRCLIKHHGLKHVVCEGLSPKAMKADLKEIAKQRAEEKQYSPILKQHLDQIRKALDDTTKISRKEAKLFEAELIQLQDEDQYHFLERNTKMGAAGRLLFAEELESILPLEGDGFQAMNDLINKGKKKLDSIYFETRHDLMMRTLTKHDPVAVTVLGAAHDLTGSIQRIVGGNCEYLQVSTKQCYETFKRLFQIKQFNGEIVRKYREFLKENAQDKQFNGRIVRQFRDYLKEKAPVPTPKGRRRVLR